MHDYDEAQDMQAEPEILPASDVVIETKNRVTTPYMTKYERARVLGARALQIRYDIFPQHVETKFGDVI